MNPLYNTKRESLTFGLWFLIVSLAVLSPIIGIGNLLNDLFELKRTNPDMAQSSAFKTHLAWIWAAALIETALGITIAVMLYKVRVRRTLTTACVLLWARFAIAFALILFAHSSSGRGRSQYRRRHHAELLMVNLVDFLPAAIQKSQSHLPVTRLNSHTGHTPLGACSPGTHPTGRA